MKHQVDATIHENENDIEFLILDTVAMKEKTVRELSSSRSWSYWVYHLEKSTCSAFECKTSAFSGSLQKKIRDLLYEDVVQGI